MAYVELEKLINLYDGYRKVVRVGTRDLLLLQLDGEPLLVDRLCPHAGYELDRGEIENACITCPLHGISFSLRDGKPQNARCAPLKTYPVALEGNSVGVEERDLQRRF